MEGDDVDGEWQKKEGGEGFAASPKGDEGEGEDDGVDHHDVLAGHEDFDEGEGFGVVVHLGGRCGEDAEGAGDRHEDDDAQNDFEDDVEGFHGKGLDCFVVL